MSIVGVTMTIPLEMDLGQENTTVFADVRSQLLTALNGSNGAPGTKDAIRLLHARQRGERAFAEESLVRAKGAKLLSFFADGTEIDPQRIRPRLVQVTRPESLEGFLFRIATLLWSVPVSRGYGRRLIDDQNSKVIGLLALGDPVFNLACRDSWIGWNAEQRRERLSFMMDAYVLGAVPPYSDLLGGKLVGSLVAAREIEETFRLRYGGRKGIISGRAKNPHLVLVTTTSALGRSSVYNRLRLAEMVEFRRLGATQGWGHFLVSDDLFRAARQVLKSHGDPYSENYNFGQGPNWRLRALRKACRFLDINDELLRHNVRREVYAVPISANWREVLLGTESEPAASRYSTEEIALAALKRWVIPRAERRADWSSWTRRDTWRSLTEVLPGMRPGNS